MGGLIFDLRQNSFYVHREIKNQNQQSKKQEKYLFKNIDLNISNVDSIDPNSFLVNRNEDNSSSDEEYNQKEKLNEIVQKKVSPKKKVKKSKMGDNNNRRETSYQ